MKLFYFILLLLLIGLTSTGCPEPEEGPDPGCRQEEDSEGINFQLLAGPDTIHPSKVSVFFKLDDDEGNSVPNLTEEDFSFFEKGLNNNCHLSLSADEAARKIIKSPQVFQYNTTLVLDLSGSVINNNLVELKEAALEFIDVVLPDTVNSGFNMEIWWFDGEDLLHQLVPITDDKILLRDGINSINSSISNDNSTDLFGAVIKSVDVTETSLNNISSGIISSASVVIFTDGRDRAQRYLRAAAIDAINNANQTISFFTIGLGSEINQEDLRNIGKDGFKLATNLSELVSSFLEIGKLVTDEANSFYNFEYCSPSRNGVSELIIQTFYNGKRGQLKIQYEATNFSGGCVL